VPFLILGLTSLFFPFVSRGKRARRLRRSPPDFSSSSPISSIYRRQETLSIKVYILARRGSSLLLVLKALGPLPGRPSLPRPLFPWVNAGDIV